MSEHAHLSREQAIARFDLFTKDINIHYDIALRLAKGEPHYFGHVGIHFTLEKISEAFFLDLNCRGEIKSIIINGTPLQSTQSYKEFVKENHLFIPTNGLKKGENTIFIFYSNEYSKGKGIYSFTDTVGAQFIYTSTEPYHANKIIPCFDQPDLKATYTLTLLIDKSWTGIGNEKVASTSTELPEHLKASFTSLSENEQVVVFKKTAKFSTYLFFLAAGAYKEVKHTEKYGEVELSCYVRASLYDALVLQAPDIFATTISGIKYFEDFFGYAYPFSKYDHIFCPDFPSNAMENPGAIGFNDRFITKDRPSSEGKTQLLKVVIHELAHMWFGDLVTMKWWNDLWLNEAFADFSAFRYLADMNRQDIESSSIYLFLQKVRRAYIADEKPTTHPIYAEVTNTEMASLVFDGITYVKGACSLLQLHRVLGHETFKKAMHVYFNKFCWNNTTIEDFIGVFHDFVKDKDINSPHSVQSWEKDWILTAGLTQIKVEWDSKDTSPNAKLKIIQSSCLKDFPANKFITVKVGFFDEKGEVLEVKNVIVQKEVTEVEYDGSKQPKAVFPNYEDDGYVKVLLDDVSKEFFRNNISKVKDLTTRSVIWYCFYLSVNNGMNPLDFVETALSALVGETSEIGLQTLLEYINNVISDKIPSKVGDLLRFQVFTKLLELIQTTDIKDEGRLLLLKRELIVHATHSDHLSIVENWLNGTEERLKAHKLRKVDKWNIVRAIIRSAKYSSAQKAKVFEALFDQDRSDAGRKVQLFLSPFVVENDEAREKIWNEFFDEKTKFKNLQLAEMMQGYRLFSEQKNAKEYCDKFFGVVFDVFNKMDDKYSILFFTHSFPTSDNLECQLEGIEKLLKLTPKNAKGWKKSLTNKQNDLQTRVKSYKEIYEALFNN